MPLSSLLRKAKVLVLRGREAERMVPLGEPVRAALAAYLEHRAFFLTKAALDLALPSRGRKGHLTRQRLAQLLKRLAPAAESTRRLSPMCCAMPSPPISSITAPICAACRRCLATRISPRRESIPMSRASG